MKYFVIKICVHSPMVQEASLHFHFLIYQNQADVSSTYIYMPLKAIYIYMPLKAIYIYSKCYRYIQIFIKNIIKLCHLCTHTNM